MLDHYILRFNTQTHTQKQKQKFLINTCKKLNSWIGGSLNGWKKYIFCNVTNFFFCLSLMEKRQQQQNEKHK